MRRLAPFLILMSLAACRDQRPALPSAEEDARLNDADAMLNEAAGNDQAK